jgi:alpha-beta hydrolase superfamily lysophospholipase
MQPFYFGSSEKPLFGAYHPPEPGTPSRPAAVLLCYPLGHEYLRAHRAFRNLAVGLAGLGFHVLRFDYFGSGDSGGSGEETTVDQCLADIEAAIEELKDMSGRTRVSLMGLRMGATLAVRAAASRDDVDRIVLWDPVLEGRAYVESLVHLHRTWRSTRLGEAGPTDVYPAELLGFPATEAGLRSLGDTRLLPIPSNCARSLRVLTSSVEPCHRELLAALADSGIPVAHEVVPGDAEWGRADVVHHILLPHAMLRAIATVMSS